MKNLQNGIVIELQIFAAVLETLLSAYEFIINRYIEYYMKNSLDMAIQKGLLISDVGNNFKLSYEKRERFYGIIYGE